MKIVFLNPTGELGGAEMALLDLLAALRSARPWWSLSLVSSAPGPLLARASVLGVSTIALPFPPALARLGEWGRRGSAAARVHLLWALGRAALPTCLYARRLRRHLRGVGPDVVHTNGFKMHVLGAWCRPEGSRVLWHLHDYPASRPVTASLLRRSAPRCAAIVTNSESVAEQTRRVTRGVVPVHAIHNAVDLERFVPEGSKLDLDALAGMPRLAADGVRIGMLGTFARWKGHAVFLRALAEVGAPVPVRGYVIGDSIYETDASQLSLAELRAMAARLQLGDKVAFTGRVVDVPAAIRALDIVVHASVEPEPFGLVIAESMACGRPVVVSCAGGAAEIAQAGAVFHQPGDSADLASRIAALVCDPAARASLGQAGRAAAVRLFGRERLAGALTGVYAALH